MEKNCLNCIHSHMNILNCVTCRRYPPVITNDNKLGVFPSIENPTVTWCGEGVLKIENQDILFRHVESLHISFRTLNALRGCRKRNWVIGKNDFDFVGEIIQETEDSLMKQKYFGRVCLMDIKQELSSLGLSLGTVLDYSPWNLPFDERRKVLKPYADARWKNAFK